MANGSGVKPKGLGFRMLQAVEKLKMHRLNQPKRLPAGMQMRSRTGKLLAEGAVRKGGEDPGKKSAKNFFHGIGSNVQRSTRRVGSDTVWEETIGNWPLCLRPIVVSHLQNR
jgi:hypothetical protein